MISGALPIPSPRERRPSNGALRRCASKDDDEKSRDLCGRNGRASAPRIAARARHAHGVASESAHHGARSERRCEGLAAHVRARLVPEPCANVARAQLPDDRPARRARRRARPAAALRRPRPPCADRARDRARSARRPRRRLLRLVQDRRAARSRRAQRCLARAEPRGAVSVRVPRPLALRGRRLVRREPAADRSYGRRRAHRVLWRRHRRRARGPAARVRFASRRFRAHVAARRAHDSQRAGGNQSRARLVERRAGRRDAVDRAALDGRRRARR